MGYQFATRNGGSIYVEETGSGSPVLALHGIGGGTFFFRGFAKRLESRYRIFSVDLPGTGNSKSSVQPFTLESIVADLGDLVADKIGEPVVVLGHSFGSMVGLKAWETWPQWFRALIFVCGLPKARPNVHERLTFRAQDIPFNGIKGWGPKMSPGVFAAEWMKREPETVALFERLFEAQDPAAYVRSIEVLLGTDVRSIVPTLKVPCMAVMGTEDSYAPPESVKEFISHIPGGCRQEILQGCGHSPFFETPEIFARAVESFLDSLSN